jgi:hypothetical protein
LAIHFFWTLEEQAKVTTRDCQAAGFQTAPWRSRLFVSKPY